MAEAGAGFLRIGKLDAARRQLNAALTLYFDEGDVVAIHTITGAAHEVLRDLAGQAGQHMLIEGSLIQGIGVEFTNEIMAIVRRPQNFFKHADRDPEAVLEFSPHVTELLLLDGIAKCLEMTAEQTDFERAYEKWFFVHNPQFWKHTPLRDFAAQAGQLFGNLSRQEFLRDFLATIRA